MTTRRTGRGKPQRRIGARALAENLLPNGSFEKANDEGQPVGWKLTYWSPLPAKGRVRLVMDAAHGRRAVQVEHVADNDNMLLLPVPAPRPAPGVTLRARVFYKKAPGEARTCLQLPQPRPENAPRRASIRLGHLEVRVQGGKTVIRLLNRRR